jgi:WD40 repeat protein
LRIENPQRLQVEGFLDEAESYRLHKGDPVTVEPSLPERPALLLRGHRDPITAVAVSKGPKTRIVSASEDRTVRVWAVRREKDSWAAAESFRLEHPAVVRSVTCSPSGSKRNLCLTADAVGVGRLWDLEKLKEPAIKLAEAHKGAILATAFNADGSLGATGGEDRAICVWQTRDGSLAHRIADAHKGPVTWLAFTPAGELVSAGRDNRLVGWSVQGSSPHVLHEVDQRSGHIEQLGLSPDGKQVLFDQGSQVRVLGLDDASSKAVIRNASGKANFTTFALFSPRDGRMILTASSSDNRVQLWSNPAVSKRGRASELRQFTWAEGAPTCAAFDPEGRFAVTGTRDRNVLLWALPAAEEVNGSEANGVIHHVGKVLDSGENQVRIVVDVIKPTSRLIPGKKATLVIDPR